MHSSRKPPKASLAPRLSSVAAVFIDRSLGSKKIAAGLIGSGLTVHTMVSVYGVQSEKVKDEDWIQHAASSGWLQFTKDAGIKTVPRERRAIISSKARVFQLANQQMKAADQIAHYVNNLDAILRAGRKPGPFLYIVYERRIELFHLVW